MYSSVFLFMEYIGITCTRSPEKSPFPAYLFYICLRISEASYRPADGPGASMGWGMRGARVVNDRVASYVGSTTVSPCVPLLSCLADWSGASDTREQIQNVIFIASVALI